MIIDEKKIAEWRAEPGPESFVFAEAHNVIETLEILWRVVRSAQVVARERYFGAGSQGQQKLRHLRGTLIPIGDEP